MSVLLLGVGNILLSDEGVGVEVIKQFENQFNPHQELEVLDGGTSGMELLPYLSNRDLVIIVDAVKTGAKPASIVLLEDKQVPTLFSNKISPHQLGLCDLLSALIMIDESPKKLFLVGVVPLSLEPHIGLTDEISACVEPMLAKVVELLAQHNINIQKK